MSGLNEAQIRVVREADGPSLVLAGAGSGKTRVIVERIAHLIGDRGVDPRHILALTFTNKAAGEMRERVAARLGRERIGAWLGTFHAFGLHLLRREIDRLNRPKTFTVFDDTDQLGLMKRLVRDLEARYEKVTPRDALGWISGLKQQLRTPADLPGTGGEDDTCRVLWNRYHERLLNASAVDFDDLLVLPARLLGEHEDIRARYGRRYQYVHVDEYQDTNHAQYEIVRLLGEQHGNLFVVGDEDQSIYAWRGATIRNILDFERDFQNAHVYRLEQNYRSTQAILDAANTLVSHNRQRLGKVLWTAEKGGEPVRLYAADDDRDEARFIAREARRVQDGSVAVLYRTNAQARVIEDALREASVPYVVIGGVKFYERKEIKDLIAYLRVLVNPADNEAMGRVLNVPRRGIGDQARAQIEGYMAERGQPMLAVLRDLEQDQTLGPRVRKETAALVHLLDDLALRAREERTVAPLVEALLDGIGYRDYVRHADEQDYRTRLEVVDEFVSMCTARDNEDPKGLENFLQDLALVTDTDTWDPKAAVVTLMTCHTAKGLEFDHVFLAGLEEGMLPHGIAVETEDGLEEERRLAYVAMTRARARLTLSHARKRLVYGEQQHREPSCFIDEIGAGRLQRVNEEAHPRAAADKAAAPGRKRASAGARAPEGPKAEPGALKMGSKVRHAKFGPGVVMFTSGSGRKQKARIKFSTGRSRDFIVSVAPLEILEE